MYIQIIFHKSDGKIASIQAKISTQFFKMRYQNAFDFTMCTYYFDCGQANQERVEQLVTLLHKSDAQNLFKDTEEQTLCDVMTNLLTKHLPTKEQKENKDSKDAKTPSANKPMTHEDFKLIRKYLGIYNWKQFKIQVRTFTNDRAHIVFTCNIRTFTNDRANIVFTCNKGDREFNPQEYKKELQKLEELFTPRFRDVDKSTYSQDNDSRTVFTIQHDKLAWLIELRELALVWKRDRDAVDERHLGQHLERLKQQAQSSTTLTSSASTVGSTQTSKTEDKDTKPTETNKVGTQPASQGQNSTALPPSSSSGATATAASATSSKDSVTCRP